MTRERKCLLWEPQGGRQGWTVTHMVGLSKDSGQQKPGKEDLAWFSKRKV
jgi:hypothetical protein